MPHSFTLTSKMPRFLKKHQPQILLALGLFALDLASKYFAVANLAKPVEIIPNVFRLSVSQNTGIAFSIGIPNEIMVFAAPLLIAAIAYILLKTHGANDPLMQWCLILILAGGLGNFINRLSMGSVTDFLELSFWPSFNLADAYLTISVFLLIIYYAKMTKTYDTNK